MKAKSVRLSNDIAPVRYKISLNPDLVNFTFKGVETIELNVLKPTNKITLHAVELEITAASLGKLNSKSISYNPDSETAEITFGNTLSKGIHKLEIAFEGILNDKMRGFYRSKYEIGGKTHHMAVTQFESTDARRAFPSFDEPDKKAIFDVELIIPKDHTAISNTIETEVLEHGTGLKILKFAPTPKMSTYLLAFIVGKFEYIEAKTEEGILVRVFVTPGKKRQAKFALSAATKILSFYSNYFKIPYPLPTLDLIAIPDFAAGAMENWGAVTYRETALLVDEQLSSTANKQWIALVIAHELAHMWFGNLVTMQWWTHLWLNEGFASYIEYLAVDNLFPKWKVWTQFVFMDHCRALELDSLKNTHPIEVEVQHPKEISEIFDAVSYSKGASIIRMLASYLGTAAFRKGLQYYLGKHKYGNAKTGDLWDALEQVSKKPVGKMMQNWTGKPGYPLVSAHFRNKKLELSQKRYFSSPISANKSKDSTVWSVPIAITSSKKIKPFLMSKKSVSVTDPKSWIKVNPNETSFIRVNYSPELLKLLDKPLAEKKLGTEDRFGIIRDAFALARSGETLTSDSLKLALLYKDEGEYVIWAEIASSLGNINNLVFGQRFYESYRAYCRDIFSVIGEKVGWDKKAGESHSQTLLRPIVLFALGKYGDRKTITRAKSLFVKPLNRLDPDLRGVIYNLIAENGGIREYARLRKMYKDTPMQEEKDRILRALCSFTDKKLLSKTLDFAFSEDVRVQDKFKAVSFVWANPYGRNLAWEFVKKHWEEIEKKFSGGHLYSRFIQPSAFFVNEKDALDIEKFFKKNPHEGLDRTIAQVTEQIRTNSAWLTRDRKNIGAFLKDFS